MIWKVEVKDKPGIFDAVGEGVKKDILDLGIENVKEVLVEQVYILEGQLEEAQVNKICRELLTDPVVQDYTYQKISNPHSQVHDPQPVANNPHPTATVEVAYNPGVMDPWEESVKKGIKDLGIDAEVSVRTAKEYQLKGDLDPDQINTICDKILVNKVIQHVVKKESKITTPPDYKFKLISVDILNAEDSDLENISKQGQLFLNLTEMKEIQKYYKEKGHNPTDCELETIAQTWSEHCGHKTFRGKIDYNGILINNLLKSTIMKVTTELNKPWCVSVFKDNSGVIEFDEDYDVCFKVETHNHPSALEPYGGANTGIGGVIRDPLGTGLGAKPILNTDVFCFGPPDYGYDLLPAGTLHPKRIMKGVVAGVRDYGNKMGIPTVNGAVLFDDKFVGNPLVYCGNAGLIPKNKAFKSVSSGDMVVLIGGKTGRDGIHGATFSSGALTVESEKVSASAVQIGNPITEKKMVDTIIQARDMGLYKAITDCGGGGLSSAVGEMGAETGVKVDLEKVPLKYHGLTYTEIWISEAQERMILCVPKENLQKLLDVFAREDVEAVCIGEFTNDKHLRLFYQGNPVCDLDMDFLHDGLPKVVRKAAWSKQTFEEPSGPQPHDLTSYLIRILSSYNVCSKEWIIRQYDHEVQGGSVIKPLVGIKNDGPGDASVAVPRLNSFKGIAVSCGINPKFSAIDTYWMAASCIDEALRNIIAVGGNLERLAILDNFCWGNTNKPHVLGTLVRASLGCYDIAKGYGVPFISGKDSLNNEYEVGGESIAIPPTLLISAIGVIDDVRKCITMDAKETGNLIYVIGNTFDELGGSHYYDILEYVGNKIPKVDTNVGKDLMTKLSRSINQGLVRSCHDCSEGGIAVALAEMAFSGGLGIETDLNKVPLGEKMDRDDYILFSESNTRFIVEVPGKHAKEFEKAMEGVSFGLIGKVSKKTSLRIKGLSGKEIITADIQDLKEAWQRPLRW